ncbi:MAG: ImmA/IrrE family metallo-endopeptidase [Candidatus Zixiibacteriota bacterium]|nr:MAG: ImmA/IrrE family metallo-endopeptidase [candidate division Zixibacteria bacterium]
MFDTKLKELRKELGLKQTEIALVLGISQDIVSKIENNRRVLTSYEIYKLSQTYDVPIEFFFEKFNLTKYREVSFRATEELKDSDRKKIPKLKQIGNKFYDIEEVLKRSADTILRKYDVKDIDIEVIRNIALEERKIFGFNDQEPISNLFELLTSYSIKILSPILEFNIHGIFLSLSADRHLIIINKDNSPAIRNFTLAHEYGHYLFHREKSFNQVSKNLENPDLLRHKEKIANIFAIEFLMPIRSFDNLKISDETISLYMHNYKVSRQALIYRLANIGIINYDEKEYYLNEFMPIEALKKLRIDSPEVKWFENASKIKRKTSADRERRKKMNVADLLSDKYKTAVIEAYEGGLITYSKVADYLFLKEKELEKIVEKKEVAYEI